MLLILLTLILTSNALTLNREISIYYSRIASLGLLSISYLLYNSLFFTALDRGIGIFGGLFTTTTFTYIFNIFICLITFMILTITAFYPRKVYIKEFSSFYNLLFNKLIYNKEIISNKTGKSFRIIEYALIIIFVITGGIFLMGSADLISIFLSIELQSYGLYIISTLYRDSEVATGSGLTYFLLGGLSSCFILLGSALLYVITGTTSLENIYIIINLFDKYDNDSLPLLYDNFSLEKTYYIQLSIIVIIVGFLFKISAAPFHFWSPDVYDGIPTIVTTFVAIVAKISIFAFLLYFVYNTQSNLFTFSWKNILILSSMLSLIIGSILGLTQFRIKRLFAYSTISHLGFILLALAINTPESVQAYIFYILQYTISNLNAFIILLSIGYSLFLYVNKENKSKDNMVDQNNSPIQLISQLKGYFYINPFIAISLAITLFSFVGIPPVIGFFGKQMVLSAALDNGYVFMSLLAILTSVIGAAYYLNLVKNLFFFKPDYVINPSIVNTNSNNNKDNLKMVSYIVSSNNDIINKILFTVKDISISSSLSTIISILTLFLVLFIYTPEEWFNIANLISLNIFKI